MPTTPDGDPLTLLHDTELSRLAKSSDEEEATPARQILALRADGASKIRVILARMYGETHIATAMSWAIVPHLTERRTLGLVDTADGTAWDSMIECGLEVDALGLDDVHTPDANHPSLGGDVRIDGDLVQRAGETPGRPITAPPGWLRIGLPTWRGYNGGDGNFLVPANLFTQEQMIRPHLRAVGLTTCYGHPGHPRRTLSDAAGHHKSSLRFPNGCPPWVTPHFEECTIDWLPLTEEQQKAVATVCASHLRYLIELAVARAPFRDQLLGLLDEGKRGDIWTLCHRDFMMMPNLNRRDSWAFGGGQAEVPHEILKDSGAAWAQGILTDLLSVPQEQIIGHRLIDVLYNSLETQTIERCHEMIAAVHQHAAALGKEYDWELIGHGVDKIVRGIALNTASIIMRPNKTGTPNYHTLASRLTKAIGPVFLDVPAADASIA